MGWSDLFFPDNPKRREQLICKAQEFKDLMKSNFYATNQLIDVMNKHLGCSFQHIELDNCATLQENCNVMIECMHKIQAVVEKIDKELKEKLEPTLYEKLLSLSLTPEDFQVVSKVLEVVCGLATLASTTVIGLLIDKGIILAKITSKFVKIGAGTLACIGLGVVFLGIDMIVDAILGSIERDRLEKALKEYDEALNEFEPASLEYQHSITYVQIKIEEMYK
ncbi:single-pass membrane and coiled-coil domain-containing protein 3-like [Megalobrama amblycephala]|uniref:single-pass membrane and coiled-coil domain-containing protein 3-like n=1 Tax=Megalobrama amblycephala TaxID=75352 RepID=UPI0020143D96|nr:single-pass membrane and coiled-coil domain-containing protein 3-like [Megalobrama amblycephala]XP_048011854.1 single-pass membrane and coiled-coil domain-containing protein 3-like [Megalobrama amblycephala]